MDGFSFGGGLFGGVCSFICDRRGCACAWHVCGVCASTECSAAVLLYYCPEVQYYCTSPVRVPYMFVHMYARLQGVQSKLPPECIMNEVSRYERTERRLMMAWMRVMPIMDNCGKKKKKEKIKEEEECVRGRVTGLPYTEVLQ